MNQWHNDHADSRPLDGTWQFRLGEASGTICVPGAWEAQDYPRHAEGPAVYTRAVHIPGDWAGRTVQLQFDALSYHVQAAVNGESVGAHTGAWSPFAFDVSRQIVPGAENTITLTVYKPGADESARFPVRESLAGFLPDVALMFGGVWQSARLVAFPGPAFSAVTLQADAATGQVTVSAHLHGADSEASATIATIAIHGPDGAALVRVPAPLHDGRLSQVVQVPEARLWSPDTPQLYTLVVEAAGASVRRRFGFRALSRDGEQLLFNGRPVFLRGVLNWGWYPDILCPAPDDDTIRDEFRRVRALGYNMVKLCLYVPAPRYFEIADEEGMFLWLELPMWLPQVTERLRAQAPPAYAAIIAAVHHHPAIILYSLGCELGHAVDADLLGHLTEIAREGTHGALLCDNSGSGEAYGGLTFDFADFNDYHFYADLQYFDPLVDHFSRDWRAPRPWIFGEFCDADDYRDLDAIREAHGGALPWWLTTFNPLHERAFVGYPEQAQRMAALGLDHDHAALARLSHRQSFMMRKTILEKVRARRGMGGYVVTGIRDTPLATSAMFDDLGQHKYPPAAFKAFNDESVLLVQPAARARRWTHGGDRPAPAAPYCFTAGERVGYEIVLAHAGAPLPGAELRWSVAVPAAPGGGRLLAESAQRLDGPFDGGPPQVVGHVDFEAPAHDHAARLELEVALGALRNRWSLYGFPAVTAWPEGVRVYDPAGALAGLDDLYTRCDEAGLDEDAVRVLVAGVLDGPVMDYVQAGGRVLLLQPGEGSLPVQACPFWRESIQWIEPHPAMDAMLYADEDAAYVDMQFYGLAADHAFDTGRLPDALPTFGDMRPIVRRLDARQFRLAAYLFEARVGAGRLMASTLRFWGGLGDQPVGLRANPAGRWLLFNLLRYLAGDHPEG